ncbi:carbohydrate ABC transporter permease [Paenibacillus sepulcri]|uniref:Carbohydrate ABC transporter permease n=1 Tax=Paenibacillus sepulcri TaxID=359917 RepID=A0ABS7BWK0_9BACL|nr:carbohydrate ABC transporter permease [Paenibacillus sepulcri]
MGNIGRKAELFVVYVCLILFALCFIIPFFWLIAESLKAPSELFEVPTKWWPETPQWVNFSLVFTSFPFMLYLKNTIIILIPNIIGSVISNSLIAYGFARLDWKYRDRVFVLVLITMILPFQVTMIPLFLLFQQFNWIGTFLPLIVPSFFGNAFFIFLLRQFLLGIPKELSYSAKIDGANEFQIYWKIIMPLAKPVISTVVIFAFLGTWNDFIGPLIFLSDNKLYTLSLGAQQIMGTYDPKWNILMALGVTMTLPVLILFFLLQKYFIQGVAMSGIKG